MSNLLPSGELPSTLSETGFAITDTLPLAPPSS
jgi:hypothetical protein